MSDRMGEQVARNAEALAAEWWCSFCPTSHPTEAARRTHIDAMHPFVALAAKRLDLAEQETAAVRAQLAGMRLRLINAETERDEAVRLLEYALHLRMHGERAPCGDETWAEFDRDAEAYLRLRARLRAQTTEPKETP